MDSGELSTGERIRMLRESRGLTREALAQMCGRGVEWLKKIESGERELRSHTLLVKLGAALQLSDLSAITGHTDGPAQPVPTGRLTHPVLPAVWAAVMNRPMSLAAPAGRSFADPAVLQGRV